MKAQQISFEGVRQGFAFRTLKCGLGLSRKRIDEIIKRCASKAGVRNGRVSPHDIRRAFAREFLRNGGDLESLRQLLGHSSYAMVKRYAQLADNVVADKHRKASSMSLGVLC